MNQFISEMAHIRILTEKFSRYHIILRCKRYKSNKEWLMGKSLKNEQHEFLDVFIFWLQNKMNYRNIGSIIQE